MNVLILGINGFIGHHLAHRILSTTDWEIYGIDRFSDRIDKYEKHPRFQFFKGDMKLNPSWVEERVMECDVVLPLAAIATPAAYITNPLDIFEIDFEANLSVVRACVRHKKRVVFPSTSEVYGMSDDQVFDPDTSCLSYGPVNKTRWIYACAKQMMDRIIFAYGQQHALRFTLFRPFNWIGPGLDRIDIEDELPARVVTQFMRNIMRKEPLVLVDGGSQRRCFTAIDDGINALMLIIKDQSGLSDGKIYNIGNPRNDYSIFELAERMRHIALEFAETLGHSGSIKFSDVSGSELYGIGYEDMVRRVPSIRNIQTDLGWVPSISLDDALREIFNAYCSDRQQ